MQLDKSIDWDGCAGLVVVIGLKVVNCCLN